MPKRYQAADQPVPITGDTRPSWMRTALCRTAPPDLHFPEGAGYTQRPQVAEAKAMCMACPVRTSCLRFALDNNERFGIYGGMTAGERDDLLRARHGRKPRESQRPATTRPGAANGLTAVTVAEIRARWTTDPEVTQAALAARYKVSRTTIGEVVRGESWKQVPA